MNFSQFLVQNPELPLPKPNTSTEQDIKKEKGKETKKEIDTKPTDIKEEAVKLEKEPNKKFNDRTFGTKPKTFIEEQDSSYQPQKFKRGDFVIIQRLENSNLNVYKGYYGQIKECRLLTDSAYVILEAMNHPRPISFPIGHLIHRTNFF